MRQRLVLATLWILSIIAVNSLTFAQAQRPQPPAPDLPNLITGSDIGFQLLSEDRAGLKGRWMVRVNGQWRPVGESGLVPLTRR